MFYNSFVYKNLVINMALVIVGYALASLTNLTSNAFVQPFKLLFLGYSLLQLKPYFSVNRNLFNVLVFGFLVLLTIPFSVSPLNSIYKFSTFILPAIYISLSISVLCRFYSWRAVYVSILKGFRVIYIIPSLSFLLFGGNLFQTNIYGDVLGAFVSNHYGWAAFLFIVTHWLLVDLNESKWKSYWSIVLVINLILLFASGSRSGLISLIVSLVIWVFKVKGKYFMKMIFSSLFIASIFLSISVQDSMLTERFDKTIRQMDSTKGSSHLSYISGSIVSSDTRTTARDVALITFENYPLLNLVGFGIFQFREGINFYSSWASPSYYKAGVHNSYGEIYFGCGIIVFLFFFFQFILKPLHIYFKYLLTYMTFVPGLFIIPYFESNITGGQFLFYPWFITIFLLLNYKKKKPI